jgi:CarD family transcriptional regulator
MKASAASDVPRPAGATGAEREATRSRTAATTAKPKTAASPPLADKPGVKTGARPAPPAAPPTPKANPETMEAEKITAEMTEKLPSPADEPATETEAAPDAAEMAAAEPIEEEDEVEEAPVRARVENGRGAQVTHGPRPQMSGPAPRIPSKAENFVEGDYVVYPTHGVGKVEKINVEDIAGHRLELIHITFEENRMTLRVPVAKARSAGLRKLATRQMFDEALAVLKGRARIKRTMWSRRAQEYEAKINSGDPLSIAEVVRDLHRNAGQPDQSFSERQIYEAAMDRLGAELAALDRTDKATAATKLAEFLKSI